jgi:hypothetical protein
MNQFGICETSVTKNEFYSLCCLQSELLDGLSTRIVCFVTNDTEAIFDEIRVPIAIKGDDFYQQWPRNPRDQSEVKSRGNSPVDEF